MKKIITILLLAAATAANAQVKEVSLQASGLTCAMCSKAVNNALAKLSFVENVLVDIKSQRYSMTLKSGEAADFDAMSKAVEEAGFSVASFTIKATVNNVTLQKDQHIVVGGHNFHFLNGNGQALNGEVNFSLVDKGFVPVKVLKKYTAMSKMACVKTGKMEPCCQPAGGSTLRVYHVIL